MTVFQSTFPDVALRDQSITDRVFEGLSNRQDEIVLTDGTTGRTFTAAQFIDHVKRLAGGLAARGLGHGSVVALMAPNMPEYAIIFHAVAYAGGTVTTLNPTYTAPEVKHQLKDSGATILFTIDMFEDTATAAIADTGVSDIVLIGSASFDELYGDSMPNQVAVDLDKHSIVLPYSSGTTGLSKGVMLSHRNMVINVDQALEMLSLEPGETTAAFLPFFHIYGMTALMNVYLGGGGCLITMPRFDLPLFLQISQDHKTQRMWIVPPVALALAKHPIVDDYDLSALRAVYTAAAPSGPELSIALSKRLDCSALQGYGMTELSPISHLIPESAPKPGSAGVLVSNTRARIVDIETGNDLGADQEGELWIQGPQVMQGYLNNPTATAETIVKDGWLRTGDIARVDAEGYMFIVDRLKELIKYKGFQVAPAELEATLVALDGITDAAVVGKIDEDAGELPVAFVVRAENGPSDAAIMAHMKSELATYKQLHGIQSVDEIPKNASGKILRRVLRDTL